MTESDYISNKILESEKRIKELLDQGDLKQLNEQEKYHLSKFYERKSLNRLETAKLILRKSSNENKNYDDFSEVVSAAYYSMYYVVHAFLALAYKRKLKEDTRGVHAITLHLIIYYLVKTNKLAKHLYEEYCNTLDTAAEIQAFSVEDRQEAAFGYAQNYKNQREKREKFTYYVSQNAEEHHASNSLQVAEEFINTIRQLMIP